MTRKRMIYLSIAAAGILTAIGWKLTSRNAYETATYTVSQSAGAFEVRQYPDLMLATTNMDATQKSDQSSFSRLFGYITGDNDNKEKVAMTTPVFMERDGNAQSQMGFVIPKKIASSRIPQPSRSDVEIQKREGGSFAVFRFAGRINPSSIAAAEDKLRSWMHTNGLQSTGDAEVAGYDPPWTPGPLRRNEILVRLD